MKIAFGAFAFISLIAASFPAQAERRCGWIQNPTPANWWLTDAEGDWIMSTQGGAQADGMDSVPDLTVHDFVATNGSYGYACGCIDGKFNTRDKTVVSILSTRQLPLSKCRADSSLPNPSK